MIRRTLTISLLCLSALSLTACAQNGLADLTTHLNERGCATKGSATASAGVTGASMGGNVEWSCAGAPAGAAVVRWTDKPAGLAPGQVVGNAPATTPPLDPG